MLKRGEIYLARLYPQKGREVGKTRPVVIFQSDMLNRIHHPTVIILPLSTRLIDDAFPLRYRLEPRDKLYKPSDILCDQIRAIDVQRIISQPLAKLTQKELNDITHQVEIVLGFLDQ